MPEALPLEKLSPEQQTEVMSSVASNRAEEGYAYNRSMGRYYEAYFQGVTDISFAIFESRKCQALILANVSQESTLGYYNHPVGVFLNDFDDKGLKYEVEQAIIRHMKKLCGELQPVSLSLPNLNFLVGGFSSENFKFQSSICAYIDLTEGEELILRKTRKSFRSLINWGRRNLKIEIVDSQTVSHEIFETLKLFHIRVAGRQTRSDLTWQRQYEAIVNGDAFALLAYLEDQKLVSANFVNMGSVEAYYGVGVYDRELMSSKMPLGHWPVVAAILEAKNRGRKTFLLGHVGPHFESEKERDIALFKRGFSNLGRVETIVSLTVGRQNPSEEA